MIQVLFFYQLKGRFAIIERLLTSFPLSTQEQWDNSGWQIRLDNTFSRALVSLSCTPDTVEEAVEQQASLLITHHPLFFRHCTSIDKTSVQGAMITTLIERGVSLFSLHTPIDAGFGGLGDFWADLLHICDRRPIEANRDNPQIGIGRIGKFPSETTPDEVAQYCRTAGFTVTAIGGCTLLVTDTIAVLPGSGADVIPTLPKRSILITSDISFHHAETAKAREIALVVIPHFEMERPFTDIVKRLLNTDEVTVIISKKETDFFTYTLP